MSGYYTCKVRRGSRAGGYLDAIGAIAQLRLYAELGA